MLAHDSYIAPLTQPNDSRRKKVNRILFANCAEKDDQRPGPEKFAALAIDVGTSKCMENRNVDGGAGFVC